MAIPPDLRQQILAAAAGINNAGTKTSTEVGKAGTEVAVNKWGIPVGEEGTAAWRVVHARLNTLSGERLAHWGAVIEQMAMDGADPGKIFAMLAKFTQVANSVGSENHHHHHPHAHELHPDATPAVAEAASTGKEI